MIRPYPSLVYRIQYPMRVILGINAGKMNDSYLLEATIALHSNGSLWTQHYWLKPKNEQKHQLLVKFQIFFILPLVNSRLPTLRLGWFFLDPPLPRPSFDQVFQVQRRFFDGIVILHQWLQVHRTYSQTEKQHLVFNLSILPFFLQKQQKLSCRSAYLPF